MSVASSVNPLLKTSVMYEWTHSFSSDAVVVDMIDSFPQSPNYNTVIKTMTGGKTGGNIWAGAATPDGKYVYVSYRDSNLHAYAIAIFDVVNGGTTLVTTSSLGLANAQYCMQVSPDGTSLLANGISTGAGQPIVVLDISQDPKNPTVVATIKGTPAGMGLATFQVVGNRLFALDVNRRYLVAFNFDRQHGNFSQLGAYSWGGDISRYPYLAASPDGAFLYLGFAGDDTISVFDGNKLAAGQSPLITNLAGFHGPLAMAVSPVTQAAGARAVQMRRR